MSAFYLISIILGVAFQNVVRKPYTDKTQGKGVYFFGFLVSLAAMIFFVVTSGGFKWNPGLILYGAFFAIAYATATVAGTVAVSCGSLSITTLIISYSLMIPAVYGLIFLKDPISFGLIPGLVLLMISLYLINTRGQGAKVTLKWIVAVFLGFFGNGMCSVVQKMQQVKFEGSYKNEFMIVALAMVTVFLGVLAFVRERKEIKSYAKAGWHMALLCGIVNGVVNLFVMILSGIMPVSIMFPMVSAGGIIVTYLVSRFYYKEKLTKTQFLGFIIGIASVVFLNL